MLSLKLTKSDVSVAQNDFKTESKNKAVFVILGLKNNVERSYTRTNTNS